MHDKTRPRPARALPWFMAPAVALMLAACGAGEGGQAASDAASAEACGAGDETTPVKVGLLFINADAGMFIAEEKGYFDEAGLDVKFERFVSGSEVVSLLATDELQVGSGSVNAGLYNSFRQGLPIKIVSSKSTVVEPNFGGASLIVRQDLWDSGEIRGRCGSPGSDGGREQRWHDIVDIRHPFARSQWHDQGRRHVEGDPGSADDPHVREQGG